MLEKRKKDTVYVIGIPSVLPSVSDIARGVRLKGSMDGIL